MSYPALTQTANKDFLIGSLGGGAKPPSAYQYRNGRIVFGDGNVNRDIYVVKVTDHTNPVQTATATLPTTYGAPGGGVYPMWVTDTLIAVNDGAGLFLYTYDPTTDTMAASGSVGLSPYKTVNYMPGMAPSGDGTKVYLLAQQASSSVDSAGPILTIDVSTPSAPTKTVSGPSSAWSNNYGSNYCMVSGSYLFTGRGIRRGLEVWDMTTPATPTKVASLASRSDQADIMWAPSAIFTHPNGKTYLSTGGGQSSVSSGSWLLYDITTPSAISVAVSGTPGGWTMYGLDYDPATGHGFSIETATASYGRSAYRLPHIGDTPPSFTYTSGTGASSDQWDPTAAISAPPWYCKIDGAAVASVVAPSGGWSTGYHVNIFEEPAVAPAAGWCVGSYWGKC